MFWSEEPECKGLMHFGFQEQTVLLSLLEAKSGGKVKSEGINKSDITRDEF